VLIQSTFIKGNLSRVAPIFVLLLLSGFAFAQSCGIKPISHIGCKVGRCVDGKWEQVCDPHIVSSCAIKPIPHIGCKIGRCVDGEWEQVCDPHIVSSCAIKPIPHIGCKIGRCVDGEWEQVCSAPSESEEDTNFIRGFKSTVREGTTLDNDHSSSQPRSAKTRTDGSAITTSTQAQKGGEENGDASDSQGPSDISVGMPRDLVLHGLIARYAFAKVDLTKLDLPADLLPFELWIAVERTTRETWRITFQDGRVVSVRKP